MKKFALLVLVTLFIARVQAQPEGSLLIIGGGAIPDYLIKKFVELAGGKDSGFLIIPMASGQPEKAAASFITKLENEGCSNIRVLIASHKEADNDTNIIKLKNVKGVFFTGGDQSKLTAVLSGTKILEGIKTIYKEGGVIGGTSAGAAVMSPVMITGKELVNIDSANNEYNAILKGNIETVKGFGFLEGVIIDQHFIKRKRLTRLINVIVDNPQFIGIGIDESTSIIVKRGTEFEVLGESQVIVFDASRCKEINSDKNGHPSAKEISLHLLKSGDVFNFQSIKKPVENLLK